MEFEPTSSIRGIFRPSGEVLPASEPIIAPQQTPFIDRPTPVMDEPTPEPDLGLTVTKRTGVSATTLVVLLAVLVGLLDISILIWRIPMARWLQTYYKRWGAQPPAFIRKWAAEEILPMPARIEGGLRTIGLQPPEFLRLWALYARLNTVGRSYIEINRALRRLGALPTADATPTERATILTRLIPNTATPVDSLLSEYQRGMYSPHAADPKIARTASREIRKLSYMALFTRWMDRLGRPVRRRPQKTG
jgi:hypothetical protein